MTGVLGEEEGGGEDWKRMKEFQKWRKEDGRETTFYFDFLHVEHKYLYFLLLTC